MQSALTFDSRLPVTPALTLANLQTAVLWLMFAMGWLVTVEPAPTDMLFGLVALLFLFTGAAVHVAAAPMILFLLLYNLGGFISYLEVSNQSKATFFVITSVYMAATAIFLAIIVPGDPVSRLKVIRNGWIIAGVVAAINGLIGYFGLFGMGEAWAPIARAQGTFKDPNVLSTFLIPPAIFLIQGFLLGTQRWRMLSALALLIILTGLFLAFSRGAWLSFIACVILLFCVSFAVSETERTRLRIVMFVILGAIAATLLLALLLSIPKVQDLFAQRASLLQDYDAGETGRFGRQARAIPILLQRPFGFGPTYFRDIFGADPHNVYINAFSSYGWLGGFSYLLLCVSTLVAGWKVMFTKTAWRVFGIAVFLPLFTTMLQGVQIDTDHWRHFYTLLGLTWGLYIATVMRQQRYRKTAL